MNGLTIRAARRTIAVCYLNYVAIEMCSLVRDGQDQAAQQQLDAMSDSKSWAALVAWAHAAMNLLSQVEMYDLRSSPYPHDRITQQIWLKQARLLTSER